MRSLIAKRLLQSRVPALLEHVQTYAEFEDVKAITQIQCDSFNAHWENAWRNIPFYAAWKAEYKLPERIGGVQDLADFPILTKSVLSDRRSLVVRTPGIERYTLTGGTSGVSTAFPMNSDDAKTSWTNTHLGRHWNGIGPGDRLFMIWGHSHLFSGRGAWRKQFMRQLKDWAANIDRKSAYNLSATELEMMATSINRARPMYVIGYGSCLAQLSYYLKDQGRDLTSAGVHRVVNTSETMVVADVPHVEDAFGCPVVNEYGSAEAGVIGYSEGSLYPVKIFWNDFIVRLVDRRIVLTTLGDRCFPLINYDTEDLSDDLAPEAGSALELQSLLGKAREIFTIRDVAGQEHDVSVVLFDHVLKQIPQVRSLHYTLQHDGRLKINYTSDGPPLNDFELWNILGQGLAREGITITPEMVVFSHLDLPLQTKAGKRLKVKYELS